MPNRWNTSVVVRVAVGMMAGIGTCGLLAPVLRPAGIGVLSAISSVRVPADRLETLVTHVWDANVYVLWLAWISAAVAVAAESVPGNVRYRAIVLHVSGEAVLLLAALLMIVHSRLVVGLGLVQVLSGVLAFSTVLLPALAVWRNSRPEPTRVFDVRSP